VAVLLHDPAVRDAIRARVQKLSPNANRKWGKMSVDQMLWHVNEALRNALGEWAPKDMRILLPKPVLRFVVLNLPWVKGAPTAPEFVAGKRYDFEAERSRCLRLIDEFTSRSIDALNWGHSAAFGDLSGRQWSQLHAKHLDHHLNQFSV
jgi:hypothetical protein